MMRQQHPFDKLFKPRSVAVVGASQNPDKVGYRVLQNLVQGGFEGEIYAINPKYLKVTGLACYPRVSAIDEPPDLVVICTPAPTVADLVHECGELGVGGVVILTAGFRETGEQGRQLESELREVADQFENMRIIGPNCVGILTPGAKLNASFARGTPRDGRVTFISQSGALCTSILDWALQEQIGFANFVSVGNMMTVGFGDLIDYFADDPRTDALVLYIESAKDAKTFALASRRCALRKPIIAYRAGRFAESAAAAASHTGALAGEDTVYEAVFRRVGIDRVYSIQELFDSAEVLARGLHSHGPRLAIVSNAGGPAVMATDTLIELNGNLAQLSKPTIKALDDLLPPNWSKQNPVDVIGDATPERLADGVRVVLEDSQVDAVLVIVSPQAMTDPTACAAAILQVAAGTEKPILTSWMGGLSMLQAVQRLNDGGLPTFSTPERAVSAFLHLVEHEESVQRIRNVPMFGLPPEPSDEQLEGIVTEVDAKAVVEDYGIQVVPTRLAGTEVEAVEMANALGYPVVLKIASPNLSHKSDIGGVQLNVQNEREVVDAYQRIMAAVHEHAPQSIIMGMAVQPMIDVRGGYELIAGAKRDPVFGPVVMIGTGGVNAEVFKDIAFELPPLNEALAREMLESLKSWPILNGYRGQPQLNVGGVTQALIALSNLASEHPEIQELDINPLLVGPKRVLALDARIILRPVRQPIGH